MIIIGLLFIISGIVYYFATKTPFSVGNIMFSGLLVAIGILFIRKRK